MKRKHETQPARYGDHDETTKKQKEYNSRKIDTFFYVQRPKTDHVTQWLDLDTKVIRRLN